LLLILGLGLCVSIVVSLALNLFPSALRSWTWTAVLLVTICSACAFAAERRRLAAPGARSELAFPLPRVRFRDLGVALAALLLFAGAVAYARTPLAAKNVQGYSAVWLLPRPRSTMTSVEVGVTSAEQQARDYRLVLRLGSKVIYRRTLSLAPGGNFATVVKLRARPPAATVVASLYLRDRPTRVYRMAALTLRSVKTR
jgi:hypothetical protein